MASTGAEWLRGSVDPPAACYFGTVFSAMALAGWKAARPGVITRPVLPGHDNPSG